MVSIPLDKIASKLRSFYLTWVEGSSELFWSKFVGCCCRLKLLTFSSSSPEPLGFQAKLAQNILGWLGDEDSSLFKWRPSPFPRRDYYEIAKFKNLLQNIKNIKNHRTNFNQAWPKVSLGEGDSSLFKLLTTFVWMKVICTYIFKNLLDMINHYKWKGLEINAFSDQNLSFVCCWHCPCRCFNFSHFHLLQNHWANFNQTWHKAS